MKKYSILNQVRVASPCNARWEDMTGNDRARFCQHCQKHVFNLSAMTRTETERLVRDKEGRFCGRYYRRVDGTILTADCPTGRRLRFRRLSRWFGVTCGTLILFLLGRTTVRSDESKPEPVTPRSGAGVSSPQLDDPILMGEVSIEPPVMGDIAVATHATPSETNIPAVMGRIEIPPATNFPTHTGE